MAEHQMETSETRFSYPSYDELPEGLMFVGEMVVYVNRIHEPLPDRVRRGKVFTNAMATNYAKGGLTPPAIGRRYNRDHLALILFAATAKLCFSAEEVYWLTARLFDQADMRASHDRIARAFADAFDGKPCDGRTGAVAVSLAARLRALSDVRDLAWPQ